MKQHPFRPPESQWLRNMVELSILFLIAVILLRGFILEGYLISTGSMAPGLRGLHKQVVCPACRHTFAFGVTFDESVDASSAAGESDEPPREAVCPNCGQTGIAVGSIPVSHGDQLLVQKGVFDFRQPHRWETVVFRNPGSPGEAYVKRVVGLPGETLQVLNGDLFIEGQISRKDLETQRDMRIAVFDIAHLSKSENWQMPWLVKGDWQVHDGHLVCASGSPGSVPYVDRIGEHDTFSWLEFRNWRVSGGSHFVEVPLNGAAAEADWQKCLLHLQSHPLTWVTRLEFDRERELLRLRGVMPYQMQQELLSWADSDVFRHAIYRLGALSHICPVTDRYGYNSAVAAQEYPVRDLMLETELMWMQAPDCISLRIPIEHEVFRVDIRVREGSAVLVSESTDEVVRSAKLGAIVPDEHGQSGLKVEMSGFDHRVLVSVNGTQLFHELDLPASAANQRTMDTRAAFRSPHEQAQRTAEIVTQESRLGLGISSPNGSVQVTNLKLYRDVHYTPGRQRNGVKTPFRVPSHCYFVQGDNSPVSSDSRNWEDPNVPHRLLVGKPFVVHLPSKPGKLTIMGYELPIRIPDLQRIRYIH